MQVWPLQRLSHPVGLGDRLFSYHPPMPGHALIYSVNQKIIVKCWGFSSEQDRVNALLAQKTEQIRDIMPESKYLREKTKPRGQEVVMGRVCDHRWLREVPGDTGLRWESEG